MNADMQELVDTALALFISVVSLGVIVFGFVLGRRFIRQIGGPDDDREWWERGSSEITSRRSDNPMERGFHGATTLENGAVMVHGDDGPTVMSQASYDQWEKDGMPGERGVPYSDIHGDGLGMKEPERETFDPSSMSDAEKDQLWADSEVANYRATEEEAGYHNGRETIMGPDGGEYYNDGISSEEVKRDEVKEDRSEPEWAGYDQNDEYAEDWANTIRERIRLRKEKESGEFDRKMGDVDRSTQSQKTPF